MVTTVAIHKLRNTQTIERPITKPKPADPNTTKGISI